MKVRTIKIFDQNFQLNRPHFSLRSKRPLSSLYSPSHCVAESSDLHGAR